MIHISATNRGTVRNKSDFYVTPKKVIHNFLDNYNLPDGNLLEPSAGNGNFISAIRERERERESNHRFISAIEIRNEVEILNTYADEVIVANFLNWCPNKQYRIIIGNPPYSLAQEFVEKCFETANNDTTIIMLLRLAFLESNKRYKFWQQHPINKLYVLSQRPSFTGKGTDATAYAWFIWDNSNNQKIKVI